MDGDKAYSGKTQFMNVRPSSVVPSWRRESKGDASSLFLPLQETVRLLIEAFREQTTYASWSRDAPSLSSKTVTESDDRPEHEPRFDKARLASRFATTGAKWRVFKLEK
jgi:hypothetical protein